jgi:hypothetical protein
VAQCRRLWNRKPGKPAFVVRVLQADRQLPRCRVGSKPVTLFQKSVPDLVKRQLGIDME